MQGNFVTSYENISFPIITLSVESFGYLLTTVLGLKCVILTKRRRWTKTIFRLFTCVIVRVCCCNLLLTRQADVTAKQIS